MKRSPTNLLIEGSATLGVDMTPAQADAFDAYLGELLKWNAKTNLTAIEKPSEVVIKHFLDAIALCPLLPEGPFDAADIGSGAGFPGMAIKILRPDMTILLIEPAKKKAVFLRHIARTLKLDGVTVIEEKAESLAESHAGSFDVIFSRAFKAPAGLLPVASSLLKEDGRVILSLGPGAPSELPPGWSVFSEKEITLPFSDFCRRLLSLVKSSTWNNI